MCYDEIDLRAYVYAESGSRVLVDFNASKHASLGWKN